MKRVYFLVPDLKSTKGVTQELEHTGITHRHIHALGGDRELLEEAHVLPASVLQTTTLQRKLKFGLLFGLVFATCLFLLLTWLLPTEIKISPLGIAAIFGFGIGFGLWSSGMAGISDRNPVIKKNEGYVRSGHYIVIAEIPKEREEELTHRVIHHHPGTKIASEEM